MPILTTSHNEDETFRHRKTTHSFAFACYHPVKNHIPELLLRDMETAHHLTYYSPSLEAYPFASVENIIQNCSEIWEHWEEPPEEVEQEQETAKKFFYVKDEYGNSESHFLSKWLNLPSCSAFLLFLSPEIMTSLPHLMLLMDSQKEQQQPMPVIPFLLEPINLNSQGEDYKDILSELEGNLPILPEEQEYFYDLLRKIHQKLHRNSNYAGFGEDSVETLNQMQAYLDQEDSVFTKELCYRVFKELINFLECNYVNLHFYTEDTMSSLYQELFSRIHSGVKQGEIPFEGNVAWVEDVDLSQFHLLSPEDCEMNGDVLVKIHSTHPKIALNFPIRTIAASVLSQSASVEEIILPQGVEIIKKAAFIESLFLRRVYLPRSLTEIETIALSYCDNLEEIVIPPYISNLRSNLFVCCSSLKKIVLPETLRTLESSVFSGCVSLEEIHLPEGLEELGHDVFGNTLSLKEITFPSTLKFIGEQTFYHSGLTKIHLPDSLTSLGDEAFARCYELEEVTGNTSPENVGEKVFEDCVKLKNSPLK